MRFIDLHCDTFDQIARSGGKKGLRNGDCAINIEKMQQAGAMVQFFAMYIRCHARLEAAGMTTPPYEYFYWEYESYLKEMAANADVIAPAFCYADILRNQEKGLITSILSIEDSVSLEGKIERVDEFYEKGVRMMSLTWNWENSLAYPQSDDPAKMQLGLKPFGIDAIRRMEELGIIIEVSHLSDGGFWDVTKYTKAPFVASHSCCRSLCNEGRNLTDDMLRKIGDRGGVCGINFYSGFLNKGSEYTAVEDVVRHARHVADVAGIDAVALGSDFDGVDNEMEFKDYAGMPMIAEGLKECFTDDEVEKICWGNTLRVIRDVIR